MNSSLVRHVLFPLHERLKRKPTFRWLAELERTQWLSPKSLAEYQFARLRRLVEFAYANVPYYRATLDEHGVPPQRLQSPHDLRDFPLLTKELIRTRFDDLRAHASLPNVHRRSSGGSTGSPVTVLVDMNRMGIAEAGRLRAHRWFHVEPGAREVVLWGSPIEITRQDRVRQIRDWCLNSRLLSAFDMGEKALERHLAAIYRHRPAKIYGYASSLFLLAGFLEHHDALPPPGLVAVFATAEPLFDFQRKTIEAALGCQVGVEYGCRDGGLVALECPEGGLHILAEGMRSPSFAIARAISEALTPRPARAAAGCRSCAASRADGPTSWLHQTVACSTRSQPSISCESSAVSASSGSCRKPSTVSSSTWLRDTRFLQRRRRRCALSSPRSLARTCG